MKPIAASGISITKKVKGKLPRLPFVAMKNFILGKKYELSVAFVEKAESKRLNRTYRRKNKPANVLSFPISKNEGEILICLSEARKDAKKFGQTYENFIPTLLIHGMLHLKGFAHGSKMERKEAAAGKKFGLSA